MEKVIVNIELEFPIVHLCPVALWSVAMHLQDMFVSLFSVYCLLRWL